uniref:Uncharacterized protein n=1 Tax=Molossus molossus TaxID=27622 RepID=A0A7J8I115_MOLMO|nr:hypothetical protein HJG59_010853 [Molossus molossus]
MLLSQGLCLCSLSLNTFCPNAQMSQYFIFFSSFLIVNISEQLFLDALYTITIIVPPPLYASSTVSFSNLALFSPWYLGLHLKNISYFSICWLVDSLFQIQYRIEILFSLLLFPMDINNPWHNVGV